MGIDAAGVEFVGVRRVTRSCFGQVDSVDHGFFHQHAVKIVPVTRQIAIGVTIQLHTDIRTEHRDVGYGRLHARSVATIQFDAYRATVDAQIGQRGEIGDNFHGVEPVALALQDRHLPRPIQPLPFAERDRAGHQIGAGRDIHVVVRCQGFLNGERVVAQTVAERAKIFHRHAFGKFIGRGAGYRAQTIRRERRCGHRACEAYGDRVPVSIEAERLVRARRAGGQNRLRGFFVIGIAEHGR